MDQATHNKIVSFIWGIADDVLRDVFVRGKYRDVILPMCGLRRLDAVLEPTKKDMLETKAMLDQAKITEQRAALNNAAQQSFYNTSKFTLRDLKSRGSQQQLQQDFMEIFPNAAFGYWKVTVERPLRLHSQLTVKAVESLRFASGDEEIRAELYDRLDEPLFENFASVRAQLEKLVSEWDAEDGEEESEESLPAEGPAQAGAA